MHPHMSTYMSISASNNLLRKFEPAIPAVDRSVPQIEVTGTVTDFRRSTIRAGT